MPKVILQYSETAAQWCSVKNVSWKFRKNSQKKPVPGPDLKPQFPIPRLKPATLLKKRPWQLFSCELCEIFIRTPFLQGTSGGFFWVLKCPWASTIKFVANIVEGLKYFTIFVNKLHPWYLVRSHLCFRLGRTKCTKSCKNHAKLFSLIANFRVSLPT